MVRHNIAANPINYSIWYDYVAGNNPQLNKVVDNLINEAKPFDSNTSLNLYKKHICNASIESFEKINGQIQKVIEQATSSINDTYNKAEESNDSFQKKSVELENLSEATAIKAVLKEIIKETQALAFTSQEMQTKLNDANKEMEQLRLELTEVRQVAVTDGLTGLLNRRAFDQTLSEIIKEDNVGSTCLSMIDIDHFKRVNDSYGHTVGDNVIKYVASLMTKFAEKNHRVARYGGEELAIIMPNTSKEKAIEISENIRNSMEKSRLKRKDNNQPLDTITLSIGITEMQSGDDAESFIIRADSALYKAKESGRNKVVLAPVS